MTSPVPQFPSDMAKPSAQAHSTESRKIFSFRRLALEIRNMIYHHSLSFSYAFDCTAADIHPPCSYSEKRVTTTWRTTPGILLLCRATTAEALAVLYTRPFVINRGCCFNSLIGNFCKPLLQNLKHVILNIDVNQDVHEAPSCAGTTFRSFWQFLMVLLGVVWDQKHSLRRLEINFTGSDGYCWLSRRRLAFRHVYVLLMNLFDVRAIPEVVLRDKLVYNTSPAQRPKVTAVLYFYTMALRRERGSTRFGMLPRDKEALITERMLLLFPAFVRWWLESEGKSWSFAWLPQWEDRRQLKKAWAESGWRCLELFPLVADRADYSEVESVFSYPELRRLIPQLPVACLH